ncbi:MAG: hypothetical protein FWG32_06650 [Oscillospiraceae bacterium]|nr:hypothetical protein [Oscillospiraceae bacterium]
MKSLLKVKRGKVLTASAIILIGIVTYIVFISFGDQSVMRFDDSPMPLSGGVILDLDSNAKPFEREEPENRSGSAPGIKIPGYQSITIPASTDNVNITLLNPEGNPCYFTFELILEDTGESLYKSKMVEPSQYIGQVTLERPLAKGEYSLTIKIRTYALESLVEMNNADVETTLAVI